MGIFEYLLGSTDKDPDEVQPPPSKGGAGPDVDEGRAKTTAARPGLHQFIARLV